jgi:hypothetical protein
VSRHFGGVAPMSGFANFLSGNLGDSEAGCGFKLSPNGLAYDAADYKVSAARLQ